MNLGYYSYLSAALGFGFLAILLLFSWRSSIQGRMLTLAVITTAVWAGFAVALSLEIEAVAGIYQVFEILRYPIWFVFLLKLFEPAAHQLTGYHFLQRWALPLCLGFTALLLVAELATIYIASTEQARSLMATLLAGHVVLAMMGLAMIEQLFRNITPEYRRPLKFLFIGAGAIFAFDFYLYANALLFLGVDRETWEARGFISLFSVPLLTIAAARNKGWSPNIFVSRDIVLHTTTLIGGGLYLLVMAAAGYYLQEIGGSWGRIAKISFFSLAVILLLFVLFSGQLRRQLRVFLGKHFYRNKYDYRSEWLNLTGTLNDKVRSTGDFEAAISVLAQIVDARAGLLWMDDGLSNYRNIAAWQTGQINEVVPNDAPLIRFLASKSYVVNLLELSSRPDEYGELQLPGWVEQVGHAWLIVPLVGIDTLAGFVLLARPRSIREVNWEDRDLLKTAARQVASHLAVLMTTDALTQAKQFEVFNRLSSYMVHDLKNITTGLELVAKNATKHRGNPDFLDDAFDSVATAAGDIRRLLAQLRNKRVALEKKVLVDMVELVTAASAKVSHRHPVPQLHPPAGDCRVIAEQSCLENVIVHLLENAQQATEDQGNVDIGLHNSDQSCVIEIRDNGYGMSADFIKNRLFRPFDTTKGNAGMGIGMYESREFIQFLGGDIHVTSEPGVGTLVRLVIPVGVDPLSCK